MKRMIVLAALIGLSGSSLVAGGSSISGSYVEARTAEVYTGGCVMNSEAGTAGKQAVLAWKVDRGSFNGVSLEGLSVVAALSGSANLGIYEMGGERATVRSSVFVDQRANAAQRIALVAMANELSNGVLGTIVNVAPTAIQFSDNSDQVQVAAGLVALDVNKHVTHDPSCGAQMWFKPLSSVADATLGLTEQHSFIGTNLGVKWSAPNQRSAFFGTFSR
jgi:Protein of unknown function (DUF1326)